MSNLYHELDAKGKQEKRTMVGEKKEDQVRQRTAKSTDVTSGPRRGKELLPNTFTYVRVNLLMETSQEVTNWAPCRTGVLDNIYAGSDVVRTTRPRRAIEGPGFPADSPRPSPTRYDCRPLSRCQRVIRKSSERGKGQDSWCCKMRAGL